MTKGRIEAFSDGVFAIIITIMVLELKAPHEGHWAALKELGVPFLAYVLSFLYVGIYWNNHHHLFHAVQRVSGGVLWANLHLLFWLSLFPFVTDWAGESHLSSSAAAAYGFVLCAAALAFWVLQRCMICCEGTDAPLARALGRDLKGKISPILYVAGIASAFWHPWLSAVFYLAVALIWLVPDRRIEKQIGKESQE
jgi:uncharacterized membrane protein